MFWAAFFVAFRMLVYEETVECNDDEEESVHGKKARKAEKFRKYTPERLTWNIIMEVWKIIFLSKMSEWVMCRFHVNLPGCKFNQWLLGGHTGVNQNLRVFKFSELTTT